MSEPRRLLSEEATDFERELLDSWGAEAPSAEVRNKVLMLAGGGAAAAAAVAAAPKATAVAATALGKWLVLIGSGVAVSAVAIAWVALAEPTAPSTAPTLVAQASPAPTHEANPVATAAPAEEATVRFSDLAPAPTSSAPAAASTPSAVATAGPSATLGDLAAQTASLDRARDSLRAGDAAGAIRLVDAYETEYPRGMLREESEFVRIQALVKLGRRSEAEAIAQRLLAARPTSPLASRIRSVLGDSNP